MFPIPWNFPFRKKNGDISTISDVINGGGGGGGSDLPPHSASDAGKLLGVDSVGTLEWTDEVSAEIQALTKYANAQSNRNLLDNPWFTVNQRGQSIYDGSLANQYTVDRWYLPIADRGTITVTNNGITLTANNSSAEPLFRQFIDALVFESCKGKVLTLSIEFADGNIISGSGLIPINAVEGNAYIHVINDLLNVNLYYRSDGRGQLNINKKASETLSVNIRAVKLELGTVSTLAMDTAPNYAEELLKCQRYFQVVAQGSRWRLDQYGGGGMVNISLPVQMRDRPTLSNTSFYLRSLDLATETAVSSATINPEHNYNELLVILGASTWNQDGQAYLKDGDLWLSADL